MIFKHKGLFIDKSPIHGWGVFISKEIKEGKLIEESPVAYKKQYGHMGEPMVPHPYQMSYEWTPTSHTWFIPTGYSTHFNHADKENVSMIIDYENDICRFYAKRDIKSNEELFINYNNKPAR